MEMDKEYFAFISYQRQDEEWAKWLADQLEHYHLPLILNGRDDLPKDLRPIFRDIDELSAGNLPKQIYQALKNSKNLIVVCSPNSAKSPWVNKEVETFIGMGKLDNIFPFIIEGVAFSKNEDEECMPKALLKLPDDKERLGANIKEYKDGPQRLCKDCPLPKDNREDKNQGNISEKGPNAAVVKIVAGMLGLHFDALWQRYEKEKIEEERKIKEQRAKLLKARSRFISEKVFEAIQYSDNHLARRLCLEIVPTPSMPDYPYTPEAESAIREVSQNHTYRLNGHFKEIFTVQFSPNGKSVISASKDNTVRIWDVACGKCTTVITGESDFHTSACFSPDGKNIALASRDNSIHIYDSITGREIKRLDGQSFIIESIAYSPNGLRLASVSRDDILQVWDIEKGESIFEHKGTYDFWGPKYNSNRLNSTIFSSDGNSILIPHNDKIQIWDIENNNPQEVGTCDGKIKMVSYSPYGDYIMAVSDNNTMYIWIADNKELLRTYKNGDQIIRDVHFANDSSSIFVDFKTEFIKWNFISDVKTEYGANLFPAQSIYFSKNKITIAGSRSNELFVKEIFIENCHKTLLGNDNHIFSMEYSDDGGRIISSSSDCICVWDSYTGELLQRIDGYALKADLDSSEAKAYTIGDKSFQIWDIPSGLCLRTFSGHDLLADCPIAMSKNGKRIATTCGNVIYIWNLYSVKKIKCAKTLASENGGTDCVCFSPDGNMLATTSCTNNNILIWDISNEELKLEMNGHTSNIRSINYSPDGKKIVTASYDGSIRIWSTETGVCEHVLHYSTDNVVFNHNGKQILFVSGGISSIWDVETGIKIQDIEINNVELATFSPDDKTVAIATTDNSILLYPVIPYKELTEQTYERYKEFPLTSEERRKYYLD